MSPSRLFFVLLFVLFAPSAFSSPRTARAQQTATTTTQSSPQALTLLQNSLAALTGGKSITDVTLSGTARRIVGPDDESGPVTVKALAGTGARLDLSLPSGTRSELRNTSSPDLAGSWSGPDGVSHAISNHNLFTDPGWFPAFTLSSLLSAPNALITYIGSEAHDGQSVIHISASQQFPALAPNGASLMQHLSQTEVFLDPNTNLPIAIAFNVHPGTPGTQGTQGTPGNSRELRTPELQNSRTPELRNSGTQGQTERFLILYKYASSGSYRSGKRSAPRDPARKCPAVHPHE